MSVSQQFKLRWNNHPNTVVQQFEALLLNNSFVDCTIGSEGKYLKAHKVVLSACSPYLQDLFSEHFDKHPVVVLKDVPYKELKCMIDYMYCGEVNISEEDLPSFLRTAQSFKLKGLAEDRIEYGAGESATVSPPQPQPQAHLAESSSDTCTAPEADVKKVSANGTPRKRGRASRRATRSDDDDSSPATKTRCAAASAPIKDEPSFDGDIDNDDSSSCNAADELDAMQEDDDLNYPCTGNSFGEFGTGLSGNENDGTDDKQSDDDEEDVSTEDNVTIEKVASNEEDVATKLKRKSSTNARKLLSIWCEGLNSTSSGAKKSGTQSSSNHERMNVRCRQCGKTYKWNSSLQKHLKFECGQKPRCFCKLCKYKNHYPTEFKKHMIRVHKIHIDTYKYLQLDGNAKTADESN